MTDRCVSRGCPDLAGHGRTGRFCRAHAELFERLARELKAEESQKYRIYGTRPGFLVDEDEEDVARAA